LIRRFGREPPISAGAMPLPPRELSTCVETEIMN